MYINLLRRLDLSNISLMYEKNQSFLTDYIIRLYDSGNHYSHKRDDRMEKT